MILEVGRWIVDNVLAQMATWKKKSNFPDNLHIAINVSSKELLDPMFYEYLSGKVKKYNIPPNHILLEITESVIINKPVEVTRVLDLVRDCGIKVALDDFGTGYSSLSYLQKYPIDILKIDKTFTDDLSTNSNDTKITKAIIALASSLDMQIVAEGVETQESLDTIEELGAQMVQGFHLSKPINALHVIDYLNQN